MRADSAQRSQRRTVIVTDAGRSSAVAIIRSLGRAGWKVITTDMDRFSPGSYSRYSDRFFRTVSPLTQPRKFVEQLAAMARHESADLVFPVTDNAILPLSANRSQFPAATVLAIPTHDQLAAVHDKVATISLAERLGIPVPRSEVVGTVEAAARHCRSLGWPVVLKPRFSRELRAGQVIARQVRYARSMKELFQAFEGSDGSDFLLQEYWDGEGCGVELLMDSGVPRLSFQHRRLREVPLTGGASSYREGVAIDPTLFEHGTTLLGELAWTGLAMVEFKVGPRGPALMEVNGRVWGSLPLAVASGVDFPLHVARLMTGELVETLDSTYVVGVRRRSLELELAWAAAVLLKRPGDGPPTLSRRSGLAVMFNLLTSVSEMDNFSSGDIRPLVAEVVRAATRFKRRVALRAAH